MTTLATVISLIALVAGGVPEGDPTNPALEAKIERYLDGELTAYDRYEFRIASSPSYLDAPGYTTTIDDEKPFKLSRGKGYVPLRVTDGDGRESRTVITVELTLFQTVFTPVGKIDPGDAVSPADFVLESKNVTRLRGEPALHNYEIENAIAKTRIRPGDVLTRRMIDAPPLVAVGSVVEAFVKNGGVVVSFRAESRSDGELNETVRVADGSRNVFRAKVIGKNLVEIIE